MRQKLTSESLDGPPVRRGVAASGLLLRATRVAEMEILTIASNSKSSAALHAAESRVRKKKKRVLSGTRVAYRVTHERREPSRPKLVQYERDPIS